MKTIKYLCMIILGLSAMSCVDLTPKPLSFYSPDNTFNTVDGLESALVTCRKQQKWERYGNAFNATCGTPLVYEYALSDLAVMAAPQANQMHNLEVQMTPTTDVKRHLRYWDLGWGALKYANTVVTYAAQAQITPESKKNALLAEGYFHRAYWYYILVNQFGDVPLILGEVQEPKLNFYSASRTTVLNQLKSDMEFAVQWLPVSVEPSYVSRAAGEHLLTKIYLALGEFENAVKSATRCIEDNGLHLMKERFGINKNDGNLDVFNDLFNEYNISAPENKEGIFVVQERLGVPGNVNGNGSTRMYNFVPYWCNGSSVKTPDGKPGTTYDAGTYQGSELVNFLGKGNAKIRPSNYAQYEIWANCGSDIRHNSNNWYDINNLYYNRPQKKGGSAAYFGKPVQKEFVLDTMQCYFSFPKNKVLIYRDELNTDKSPTGGFTDSYVFRLAETYLLRAEAYWWLNEIDKATVDVNTIRSRAKAPELSTVTLNDILDERARELFLEEYRKGELTRIAFLMAKEGRNGYSISNFHENNWYYDRVIDKNNFYKEEYFYSTNAYIIKPYHVLWPIPLTSIKSNTQGHINQNMGYPGCETNIPVE